MAQPLRVAYFPDSFHEVNGVAHTSRQFEAFAQRRNLPFLCVRAGSRAERHARAGSVETLELKRGFLAFALEKDLSFDPGFVRHLPDITRTLRRFRPDVIHITGPSELGVLGAALSDWFGIPLAASWHTNVHEYAARRALWLTRRLPAAAKAIENTSLSITAGFYSLASVLYAPNTALCELLARATGRPCHLMQRGVDTELFSPANRSRGVQDKTLLLGFTGRLSVEKNVSLLARIHRELIERGVCGFRFLIIGHGAEESWLRQNLPQAEFAGVLRGAALARAYADMDVFVFPSHTDTFGNVVLEALASGVPAVVTPDGGPRFLIEGGTTGYVAEDDDFPEAILRITQDRCQHQKMRAAARDYALGASWDAVFEGVYAAYPV